MQFVRLFQSIALGGSVALLSACGGDDVPICYPDADVTCSSANASDAGFDANQGGTDSCETLAGSCLFSDGEDTTCSDFFAANMQASALQAACEQEEQGAWSNAACDSRGTFNVGCRTGTTGFCTTAWYNADPDELQAADEACGFTGGTPQ